jgi:hypothetical protein
VKLEVSEQDRRSRITALTRAGKAVVAKARRTLGRSAAPALRGHSAMRRRSSFAPSSKRSPQRNSTRVLRRLRNGGTLSSRGWHGGCWRWDWFGDRRVQQGA